MLFLADLHNIDILLIYMLLILSAGTIVSFNITCSGIITLCESVIRTIALEAQISAATFVTRRNLQISNLHWLWTIVQLIWTPFFVRSDSQSIVVGSLGTSRCMSAVKAQHNSNIFG